MFKNISSSNNIIFFFIHLYVVFLRFVEIVMSSLSCLNGSFLMLNDIHYTCTENNHGIDFDLAALCFDAISHVRNTSLSDLVSIQFMLSVSICFNH